ncbi:glycosyltransferase family 61 protein [Variovorax sp. PBS-H4]|uniref:glycosyltransferase family 61 protein n=1 Tax=Variovorax sp. PBS-H4 TaxID=434008 RepID=UPI0013A57059|nr:glycosyltransferase family 61 protein [Variovorax sp. PBS-H4]
MKNAESVRLVELQRVAEEERLESERVANLMREIFNSKWYVFRYSDIRDEGAALGHYLEYGWRERRWPHPLFDPDFYTAQLPPELQENANPLLHYLEADSLLDPHPLFNSAWYKQTYMGTAELSIKPLVHFSQKGGPAGNNPCLLFDSKWYGEQHPDLAELGWLPVYHYAHFGWQKLTRPHPRFDSRWYSDKYLNGRSMDPLAHYLRKGLHSANVPLQDFDPQTYLDLNPDVRDAGIDAYLHYVEWGSKEGRLTRQPAHSYMFTDFGLLTQAIQGVGANCRKNEIRFSLPLRRTWEADGCPGALVYESKEEGVEGISDPVPFILRPRVLALNSSYAIGGTRYVIDEHGMLLNDEESYFFDDKKVGVKWGGATRGDGSRMNIRAHLRAGKYMESGINLMHEHSENYFHFIAETLPRMILVEEADISAEVPYLFETGLHENLRQLIDLVNVKGRPIVWLEPGCLVFFKTMYLPDNVSCVPNAYGGGAAATKTALDINRISVAVQRCKRALVPQGDLRRRKMYVSRRGRYRNIVNQQMIERVLSRLDFDLRSVDHLDLKDQVSLFDSAEVIISPTGAQLTNIVWCRPGAVLNYLVADHPSMQLHLWGLLGLVSGTKVVWTKGPRARRIEGEHSVHDDYFIDESSILRSLENLDLGVENC